MCVWSQIYLKTGNAFFGSDLRVNCGFYFSDQSHITTDVSRLIQF